MNNLKKCYKCKLVKFLSDFYKDRTKKDGLSCWCKICRLEEAKSHREKYPFKKLLKNLRQRCENPNQPAYKYYGKKGVKCLLMEQDLKFLWRRDNAHLLKQPSIDRIDNNRDYCLDNCRFIEMKENAGRNKRKSILQFDLNGKLLKEWNSLISASKKLGIGIGNITLVAQGKRKTTGGYIWKYKNR